MTQPDPVPYLVRHFYKSWQDAHAILFAAAFLQKEVDMPEGYQLPEGAWDALFRVGKVVQKYRWLVEDMEKAQKHENAD